MNYMRIYVWSVVIATVLFCASMGPAFGQGRSEDRDNPTSLTSTEINDNLDGSGDQYFYKFSAGPGKLTVTFEVKASGTNAGATLDLFDNKSRSLLADVLAQGVDGGAERVVNSVSISFASKVRIRCWTQSVPPAVAGGCVANTKLQLTQSSNLDKSAP